jgi:uncharacterized protein (TIGR03382 family)
VQDVSGNPQKTAPCGGAFTPTNDVTEVQTGATLPITITETTFHPGRYSVFLAADIASLPADRPVTADAQSACGTLDIVADPQLPMLADDLLDHTAKFNPTTQSTSVTLPAGMQCDHCVLQIVEFMHNHPAPCYYHHCAIINVSDSAPPPVDAGTTPPGDDAGMDPGGGGGGGGGCCSTSGSGGATGLIGLLAFAMLLRRRR